MDFVRRSAHRVDELASAFNMSDWIEDHRRRKWCFAGKQARADDGRWSQKALQWKPIGYGRNPGRPRTRWTDEIDRFAGGDWMQIALDEDQWDLLQDFFVNAAGT